MSEFGSLSAGREPPPFSASRDLIVVVEPPEAKRAAEPPVGATDRLFLSRFPLAATAALAVVVAVAGALLLEDRQQAKALAEQASENASLARTVKALKLPGNADVRLVQRDGATVGTLVGVPARDPAKWARELVATATRAGSPVTKEAGFTLLPYGGGDVVAVGARGCRGILVSAAQPSGSHAFRPSPKGRRKSS